LSWGAGASPTAAHWAVAEQPTKVRSSPRASNSPHFCLILTFCLLLLPLCLALCVPCSTPQSLPLADKRINSGRVDPQAAAAAAAGAIARIPGPGGRQQHRHLPHVFAFRL
jgi:hypothetical protein